MCLALVGRRSPSYLGHSNGLVLHEVHDVGGVSTRGRPPQAGTHHRSEEHTLAEEEFVEVLLAAVFPPIVVLKLIAPLLELRT